MDAITKLKKVHGATYELMLTMRSYVRGQLEDIAEDICCRYDNNEVAMGMLRGFPLPSRLSFPQENGLFSLALTPDGVRYERLLDDNTRQYEDVFGWHHMDVEAIIEILDYLLDKHHGLTQGRLIQTH